MNSKEFINRIRKTGEATNDEIAKFMIKNYFLKGYTFEDFEEDLVLRHNISESYAKALTESFREVLKRWSR